MQLLNSLNSSTSLLESEKGAETSLLQNSRTTQAKLSMIWVKESDGICQRLIARWVTQD